MSSHMRALSLSDDDLMTARCSYCVTSRAAWTPWTKGQRDEGTKGRFTSWAAGSGMMAHAFIVLLRMVNK